MSESRLSAIQVLYLECLNNEDESIREEAVKHLLDLLDSDLIDPLIELARQNDTQGQLEAIWLLGKSEETRVTETLLEIFASPDPQVREVVAGALAEIGDVRALQPLIEALDDESNTVKDSAAIALGELRDSRAIKPLIKQLEDLGGQQVAAWALAMIGDKRAIQPLTNVLLQAEDASFRGMAARSLGKLALPEADQAVIQGLEDEDETVLIEVIRVLGERKITSSIEAVETLFKETEMERVQLACAVAMARIGRGEDYASYLEQTLNHDSDWGARLSAVIGLRQMPYEQAEKALREALNDVHWLVQKTAARSLLQLQDEELYAALEDLLGEEEEDIMQAVIESSFLELIDEANLETDDDDDEQE